MSEDELERERIHDEKQAMLKEITSLRAEVVERLMARITEMGKLLDRVEHETKVHLVSWQELCVPDCPRCQWEKMKRQPNSPRFPNLTEI